MASEVEDKIDVFGNAMWLLGRASKSSNLDEIEHTRRVATSDKGNLLRLIDPERRAREQTVIRAAKAVCGSATPEDTHIAVVKERYRALVYALDALDTAPAPDQGARER